MKFSSLNDAVSALMGKVVVFNSLCETDYECDADVGMKGRVKNITINSHDIIKIEVDLSEFESHNDPLMQKNYYGKNGVPCLTMKEANMYDGTETVYTEFGFNLPFDLESEVEAEKVAKDMKLQELLKEYRPSMTLDIVHAWAADVVALLKK